MSPLPAGGASAARTHPSGRLHRWTPVVAIAAGLFTAVGCGASEPGTGAPPSPSRVSPATTLAVPPHAQGGSVRLPPATGVPPGATGTTGPGGTTPKPSIDAVDVRTPSTCRPGAVVPVTVRYRTSGVDRVAVLLDGSQVPQDAPVSGEVRITVACDDVAHQVFVVGASPANETATQAAAFVLTPSTAGP